MVPKLFRLDGMFYIKFWKRCQAALHSFWEWPRRICFNSLTRIFHKMFQNLKIHFKRKTIKFFTCRILLNWFHPHILLLKALELLRLMALISLQNLRKNHTNGSFLKTQLKRHTQPSGPTGERDLSVHLSFEKKKLTFSGTYFILLFIMITCV